MDLGILISAAASFWDSYKGWNNSVLEISYFYLQCLLLEDDKIFGRRKNKVNFMGRIQM